MNHRNFLIGLAYSLGLFTLLIEHLQWRAGTIFIKVRQYVLLEWILVGLAVFSMTCAFVSLITH